MHVFISITTLLLFVCSQNAFVNGDVLKSFLGEMIKEQILLILGIKQDPVKPMIDAKTAILQLLKTKL